MGGWQNHLAIVVYIRPGLCLAVGGSKRDDVGPNFRSSNRKIFVGWGVGHVHRLNMSSSNFSERVPPTRAPNFRVGAHWPESMARMPFSAFKRPRFLSATHSCGGLVAQVESLQGVWAMSKRYYCRIVVGFFIGGNTTMCRALARVNRLQGRWRQDPLPLKSAPGPLSVNSGGKTVGKTWRV